MDDFETSKGFQDIFMSEPTRKLLLAELNAELPFRDNIHALEVGTPRRFGDSVITLFPNGHMLGSVQVAVESPKAMRLGYSGDFQWPLDHVIEVEALVVDSTYGSPDKKREYSQEEAESRLLALVVSKLKAGPVHIRAHRGTLQRALQVISDNVNCPILGSRGLCKEVEVYREFGYGIGFMLSAESVEGRAAMTEARFIRFYGKGDGLPVEIGAGTTVVLSAYMSRPDDPILEYTERTFRAALSNHADFYGTLEYIRSTRAKYVVTDNTRGGHALELAREINSRLGIQARPSSHESTREWGI